MNIEIDNQMYYLNVGKLTDDLQKIYISHVSKSIPLPNGKKIDIDKKSLPVLMLKQLMALLFIPMLDSLYTAKEEKLDKPTKGTDLIDYFVTHLLSFVGRHQDNVQLIIAVQDNDAGVKTVKSISTTRQGGNTTGNEPTREETVQQT